MEDILEKIRSIIAKGDLKEAIQELSSLLGKDKKQDEVILQSARLHLLEKEVRLGVIDFENANLTRNQIIDGLLGICRDLEAYTPAKPSPSYLEKNYLNNLIKKCEFIQLDLIDRSLLKKASNDNSKQDDAKPIRKVKISEVFTPLKFSFDNIAVTQKIANSLGYNIDFSDKEVEVLYRLEAVRAVAAIGKEEAQDERSKTSEEGKPNCLIILGHTGGGKSTLVNHLTVQLAKKRLFGNFDDEKKMPAWKSEQRPSIVRIILREFATWLSKRDPNININNLVWNYLQTRYEEFYPELKEDLVNNGGIVFFDGLDEVSASVTNNQRREVIEAIGAFAGYQPKYTIIITCREYVFQDPKQADQIRELLDEQQFPVARLALFQRRDIRAFVRNWYKLLGDYNGWGAQTSTQKARALIAEIDKIPHLKQLATSPLLLTLMANVHYLDGSLPERRADLYDRTIMLRLIHWENPEHDEKLVKAEFLKEYKVPKKIMRDILAEVAFIAHEPQKQNNESAENAGNILASELSKRLKESLRNPKEKDQESVQHFLETLKENYGSHYLTQIPYIAEQFPKYLEDRAGLLQIHGKNEEVEASYVFSHRTFQEYLAADYILAQKDFEAMLKIRVREKLDWWREVFLFATGICIKNRLNDFVALIVSILPESDEEGDVTQYLDQVLMAAQALIENKVEKAFKNQIYTRTLNEVRELLLHILISEKELDSSYRTSVDTSLARLGDPREEVLSVDQMKFCYVPPGSFFKSRENTHQHKQSDLSEDSIDQAFWISRFPVSNAHFQQFIDAGGYAEQAFWKENVNWVNGQYDGRSAPEIDDSPYGLPNHPVVGISWFEAMAFTRWLTWKWRIEDILPSGYMVRLPTEKEWEKAGRGGIKIPQKPLILPIRKIEWECSCPEVDNAHPRRIYPWGGTEGDPNRMNFHGSNVGCTTPLGCYPGGASPCGCEGMSGNISEWCFGKYDRATGRGDDSLSIMGGSYSDLADSCCSTHQEKKKWNVTMDSIGFRLVIATR